MRRAWRPAFITAAAACFGPLAVACSHPAPPANPLEAGNPTLGKQAIQRYGCGSCHTIPGVHGADALVGPPLTHFSQRAFIAGQLGNTEANLVRWIQNPQAVDPGNAMPNLGVTDSDAANMAAYIEHIR